MSNQPQFTPGPWKVNGYEGVVDKDGNTVTPSYCGCEICLKRADAHLIAAAPEMYELLEEVLNHPKMAFDNGEHETITIHDKIVRLLAKARGEEATNV